MFTNPALVRRSTRGRPLTAAFGGLAIALALAACGSTNDTTDTASSSKGGSASGGSSAAPGECGSVPTKAQPDPSGVIKALPQNLQANYNLFSTPVVASAWANWKPSHPAPYKVGILWQPPVNPFVTNTHDALVSALKSSGKVDIVADLAPQNPTDVPGSLQQFNQIVAKKPDVIIAFPLAPEPFVEPINKAGEAGIPVITAWSSVPSKYAVGVLANITLSTARQTAALLDTIGGKGSVLEVHGIPGITSDNDNFAGFKAALDLCPDVKVAGEVTGNFASAAAKAATLQFLSTHPAGVDGVLQGGVMTPGVIQAFQQLGKPVPPIADVGSTQGSLAYFAKNKDAFVNGVSTPDKAIGEAPARVALRMLNGDGVKLTQLVTVMKPITRDNLGEVVQPDWDPASLADASIPGDDLFSDTDLDAFFGAK